MIRGAIFDADGTLLDSMGMWETAGVRYLESLGVEARPGLREVLFPMSLADCAVYLRREYGLTETEPEIEDGINRIIRIFYTQEVEAKPGAAEFLEGLRRRGIGITLATATDRSCIVAGLNRAGLLSYFDEIFTCGELGLDKNTPEIFHMARNRMGTKPEDTWVFEDAVHAAGTAFRGGFKVAGVADPYSDQDALRKVCHIYLPELNDEEDFYRAASEME